MGYKDGKELGRMSLTETITIFDRIEDAEDNLEGVRNLPGFQFGYVKVVNHKNKRGHVVLTIFYTVTVLWLGILLARRRF
jgi:hypothetical protein